MPPARCCRELPTGRRRGRGRRRAALHHRAGRDRQPDRRPRPSRRRDRRRTAGPRRRRQRLHSCPARDLGVLPSRSSQRRRSATAASSASSSRCAADAAVRVRRRCVSIALTAGARRARKSSWARPPSSAICRCALPASRRGRADSRRSRSAVAEPIDPTTQLASAAIGLIDANGKLVAQAPFEAADLKPGQPVMAALRTAGELPAAGRGDRHRRAHGHERLRAHRGCARQAPWN